MAIALAIEDVKRTDDVLVWPEDIHVDWSANGRFNKVTQSSVEGLAKLILAEGQLQAVGCRRSADKKLHLAFGFRRWMAIKYINDKLQPDNPIRIRARIFDGNEQDAFEKNVAENLKNGRKEVTILDDAHNQKIFRERFQWDDEKIAGFYECTVTWVGQLKTLLLLSEKVKRAIQDGVLAPSAALRVAQQGLSDAEQDALIDKLVSENPEPEPSGKKKKPKNRASTAKVEDSVRETKNNRGQAGPARRISHVKKFFSELIAAEDEPENIKVFSESLLEWLAGKKTDKQLSNAIVKLIG